MSAILHSIVTSIENDRISSLLDNWRRPILIAKASYWTIRSRVARERCESYNVYQLPFQTEIAMIESVDKFFDQVCHECHKNFNQRRVINYVQQEFCGNWIMEPCCIDCLRKEKHYTYCDYCDGYCDINDFNYEADQCERCIWWCNNSDSD